MGPVLKCSSGIVKVQPGGDRDLPIPDVDALLEERRHLLETIAALRRLAVAAEAALFGSRTGQHGKRLEALLRALEMADYGQQENAAAEISV